jgi:hypothetical protein
VHVNVTAAYAGSSNDSIRLSTKTRSFKLKPLLLLLLLLLPCWCTAGFILLVSPSLAAVLQQQPAAAATSLEAILRGAMVAAASVS